MALSLTVSEILTFFLFFRKNSRWPPKVAKIETFQFCIEYFATTPWVKNFVQIALSLTVSEIFRFLRFSQKFKMAAKSGENWNFSILYRILCYYPMGKKFCPNRSISYGFWDIQIFSFFAKIQDGRQKWRKLQFFNFVQNTFLLPCESKILSKSLYLLRFVRYSDFFVFRKNSRWPPKVSKIENFQFCTEYSSTTLWVKNCVEIALSLTVSEILRFFRFSQKIKMAAKSGENWNFSILYRILWYYPMGQKFCPNRSISYGFWDIQIFSFFAKIQDGRQKWRKLQFFNFVQNTFLLPCESKILSKSLYLLRFVRYSDFFVFRKNSRWPPKVSKIENFQFCTEYSSTTLWVKNCVEIALSLTVSEILRFFHFSQKIKMAAKSGENWNFSILIEYSATTLRIKNSVQITLSLTVSEILIFFVFHKNSRWPPKVAKIEFFQFHIEYSATTLRIEYFPTLYQKFCRNHSISYGFQDINIFCFSAKIQDGRQKWRKLKFFNFV